MLFALLRIGKDQWSHAGASLVAAQAGRAGAREAHLVSQAMPWQAPPGITVPSPRGVALGTAQAAGRADFEEPGTQRRGGRLLQHKAGVTLQARSFRVAPEAMRGANLPHNHRRLHWQRAKRTSTRIHSRHEYPRPGSPGEVLNLPLCQVGKIAWFVQTAKQTTWAIVDMEKIWLKAKDLKKAPSKGNQTKRGC